MRIWILHNSALFFVPIRCPRKIVKWLKVQTKAFFFHVNYSCFKIEKAIGGIPFQSFTENDWKAMGLSDVALVTLKHIMNEVSGVALVIRTWSFDYVLFLRLESVYMMQLFNVAVILTTALMMVMKFLVSATELYSCRECRVFLIKLQCGSRDYFACLYFGVAMWQQAPSRVCIPTSQTWVTTSISGFLRAWSLHTLLKDAVLENTLLKTFDMHMISYTYN